MSEYIVIFYGSKDFVFNAIGYEYYDIDYEKFSNTDLLYSNINILLLNLHPFLLIYFYPGTNYYPYPS